ncbi:putative MFS family arabinose efflux permease [Antricoccus suffuscus]|uniref:Putative MFS family arabinose efflux permease n=1 Tax=Antricoccus suffuscus TaxID=1629062 RepID=A0A2T0ZJZ3_9ACTN|nr:MFS transporter [Antricoccus suffuscus]PRZ36637.1 putative MFS family arabinose efflux permease [Antricoccus suffuscus]
METEQQSGLRGWLAVTAIGLGIFAMVTIEEAPIGLLSMIAGDLRASPGLVGLSVTVPGIVAALAAPMVPVATRKLDRRFVLTAALLVMVVGCIGSYFSGSLIALLLSRVLIGLSLGGFWSLAAAVAVRHVSPNHAARATSIVFSGVSAGIVIGVPLSTWVGTMLGWRLSFLLIAAFGAVVAAALFFLLPPTPPQNALRPRDLLHSTTRSGVRFAVLLTFLIVTAQFLAYTYASPGLQQMANVAPGGISAMLLIFGVAGLVGNFAIGAVSGRRPNLALALITAVTGTVLVVFPVAGTTPAIGGVLMAIWGLFAGAASVSITTWVLKVSPGSEEIATAVNSSIFNLSIALGALGGGVVVDNAGVRTAFVVAGVAMYVGLGVVLIAVRRRVVESAQRV